MAYLSNWKDANLWIHGAIAETSKSFYFHLSTFVHSVDLDLNNV
jgi:hypothetical protein